MSTKKSRMGNVGKSGVRLCKKGETLSLVLVSFNFAAIRDGQDNRNVKHAGSGHISRFGF